MRPEAGPRKVTPLPVPKPARLPLKQLLLVLGLVATAYAAALLVWGDNPRSSLAHLWSWTGLQAGLLCLLNYGLRGLRWRLWMAHYGRHFGPLQGLRLYLAGYAFTPTPGNVGEAARGMMLAHNPRTIERLGGRRCDVMLSGHTHGGQVNWPGLGRIALGRRTKQFAAGLYRHDQTHLYVNKGVGFGWRFRFGVRPEIAVFQLRCAI